MFLHKVCILLSLLVTAALCHLLALFRRLGALLIERNTNQSEAKDSLAARLLHITRAREYVAPSSFFFFFSLTFVLQRLLICFHIICRPHLNLVFF